MDNAKLIAELTDICITQAEIIQMNDEIKTVDGEELSPEAIDELSNGKGDDEP